MNKILKVLISLVVKKKQRIVKQEFAVRQGRDQIRELKAKGLQLPIITL